MRYEIFHGSSYAIQSVWSAIYCLAGDIDDYSIVRYFVIIHNTVGIIVCEIQINMGDWLHKTVDVLIFNMYWDMKYSSGSSYAIQNVLSAIYCLVRDIDDYSFIW